MKKLKKGQKKETKEQRLAKKLRKLSDHEAPWRLDTYVDRWIDQMKERKNE
jgi:hypothetical protein